MSSGGVPHISGGLPGSGCRVLSNAGQLDQLLNFCIVLQSENRLKKLKWGLDSTTCSCTVCVGGVKRDSGQAQRFQVYLYFLYTGIHGG